MPRLVSFVVDTATPTATVKGTTISTTGAQQADVAATDAATTTV